MVAVEVGAGTGAVEEGIGAAGIVITGASFPINLFGRLLCLIDLCFL